MHWFGGSMAEAVALSKQRNAIFVVFVEDDNQLSKEFAETIDDSAVLKRLSDQNNFLAVKLKSGSENYTFFAQIYQFVPVPSLFFIGRNGTPLEVVCPGVQPDQLAVRIDRILEEHYKDRKPSSVQPSTSTQNMRQETANFMQTEAAALTAQAQPKPEPAENIPTTPSVPQPAPSVPQPAPSVPQPKTSAANDEEPETSSGPAAKIQKTEHHEVTRSGQEYDVVCDGDVCVRRPRVDHAGPSSEPAPETKTEQHEVTRSGQEYDVICDGDVCVRRPRVDRAGPSSEPAPETTSVAGSDAVPIDDKVERAKELLIARRREKEEKEKELEKQKERERRAVGQGVAELKRWQADQELKQIQEERKREKMENNLARQRILEQIAQDRAERRAREQPPPAPTTQPTQVTPPASVGDNTGRARVQFKLPDGAAHTAHFDYTTALRDVHRYVADNLQLSNSSFSLWTAFPRRELTDLDATLLDLQLVPSAALLVLPRRADTVAAAPSAFASVVTFFTQLFTSMILEPSYQLYYWLRRRLLPSNRPPSPDPPANPSTRAANPPVHVRRRGNIHRVTADRPEDDDDNNTWNGNSTQQM